MLLFESARSEDRRMLEALLWEQGDDIVGCARIEDYPYVAMVRPLVVAKAFRRKGVGQLLLEQILPTGKPIVTSEYAGTVGVPVLFSEQYFPNLLALQPDQGCKGVILKHNDNALRIACPEAEVDIDTPGDFQKLEA